MSNKFQLTETEFDNITDKLIDTTDHLQPVLDLLGLLYSALDVETELARAGFAICIECDNWAYIVWDEYCEVCQGEMDDIN